MLIMFFNSS